VTYGAAAGLQETPLVGASTDEAQNLWAATPQALYLLKPGDKSFKRFDAADGLHLFGNQERYCRNGYIAPSDYCPASDTSYGAATQAGIREIVGGGVGEVFVGYTGDDSGVGDLTDPGLHTGKVDRVRLKADGSLQVDRFDFESIDHGGVYWHDRTIDRLVFDHFAHPHTLYVGTNHGVDLVLPDKFRLPLPGEWFDLANQEYMGDHLHARVCYHAPCDSTESNQRMGDWRGLAVDARGDLWHGGKWTGGWIQWNASPLTWVYQGGTPALVGFGDPYFGPGSGNPPVFQPPQEGDPVNISAVTVAPDGKVWFASGIMGCSPTSTNLELRCYGIASWTKSQGFTYYDPGALGSPEYGVVDLVALPDGRLVIATASSGLAIYDPATGNKSSVRAGSGLPDDQVQRLELDTMVSPPALHVSTATGFATLRKLP
jgi:hypothetical protein